MTGLSMRWTSLHDRHVTNASNHESDLAWFRRLAGDFDLELIDRINDYTMLALQGPAARPHVGGVADGELPARFRIRELRVAGVPAPPHTTPVRRLDEAGAAKRPVIRQTLLEPDTPPLLRAL